MNLQLRSISAIMRCNCSKQLQDEQTGKIITEYRTPQREESDLAFATICQNKETPDPQNLYYQIAKFFGKTLDSMGKGDSEDGSNGRRRRKNKL
jgi:hypothetical protein